MSTWRIVRAARPWPLAPSRTPRWPGAPGRSAVSGAGTSAAGDDDVGPVRPGDVVAERPAVHPALGQPLAQGLAHPLVHAVEVGAAVHDRDEAGVDHDAVGVVDHDFTR